MPPPFFCITSDFGYIGRIAWANYNTSASGYKYGIVWFSRNDWFSDLLKGIHPSILRSLGVPFN